MQSSTGSHSPRVPDPEAAKAAKAFDLDAVELGVLNPYNITKDGTKKEVRFVAASWWAAVRDSVGDVFTNIRERKRAKN